MAPGDLCASGVGWVLYGCGSYRRGRRLAIAPDDSANADNRGPIVSSGSASHHPMRAAITRATKRAPGCAPTPPALCFSSCSSSWVPGRPAIVIPDEQPLIERTLIELADSGAFDLILTTGGTGPPPRSTPEATLAVADRLAPGFAEAMRAASLRVTPHALLSRAGSVLRNRTLIINMPGSPKACREHFAVIAPALPHAVETLRGEAYECATPAETVDTAETGKLSEQLG